MYFVDIERELVAEVSEFGPPNGIATQGYGGSGSWTRAQCIYRFCVLFFLVAAKEDRTDEVHITTSYMMRDDANHPHKTCSVERKRKRTSKTNKTMLAFVVRIRILCKFLAHNPSNLFSSNGKQTY